MIYLVKPFYFNKTHQIMKKITLKYFTILCGLLLMQPVLLGQSESQSLMGRAPQNLYDAYLASNPQTESSFNAPGDVQVLDITNGIYGNFPLVGPYTINQVSNVTEAIFAADLDNNNVLYGLDNDGLTLVTVDIVDGTTAVVGALTGLNTGHTVTGLSWNLTNSTMYALSTDGTTTTLYTIDLATGTMTIIGNTGNTLGIWIAIDNAGVCYMADIGDDQLYSVDLDTAASTVIGPLGIDIGFAQEADVDPATNELYMAGFLGATLESNVYTVDVTTGATTLQGTTNGAELGIFAIEGEPVLNDDPETAATLIVGEVFGDNPVIADNTEATTTAIDDPSCGAFTEADLWYTFVVPDSGSVTVETQEDDGSITDTAISIYEGEIGALVEVICDDNDGTGAFSFAELEGRTPGEVLFVRVWESGGGTLGTFQISAYDTPPPANDDPEGAIPITVGAVFTDFPVTASNVSATDTAIDDPSCGNYGGADVWFTVVAPSTGQLTIETNTASGITDTAVAIYSGEIGSLVEIACDDDDGVGLFSLIELTDQDPFATLFVRVWEWGGGGFGPFQIAAFSDCPVNAAAIEITGTGGTEVSICAGDGMPDPVDVTIVGEGVGTNSGWVITDQATGEILGLPMAPPFDLEDVDPGICDVWYIRYEDGLTGLEMGLNVADLDGCYDLSNPISIDRVSEGGVCDMCEYTLEMNDSFGDGWNGAFMDVLVDGFVVLDDVALDDDPNNDGSQGFLTFPVNSSADVTTMFLDGGGFPGEITYRILDANGQEVAAGTADPTTDIMSGTLTADCPSCLAPSDLIAENITDVSADLSWTDSNIPAAMSYDLEWGVAGFTPGMGTLEGGLTDTAFMLSGLEPDTAYDFYVTSNCDADVSSTLAGPFTFTTTVSCFAVTDLMAENITETSADLSWIDPNDPVAMSYDLEWGEAGFALGTGTLEAGLTATSFPLTGLDIGTSFDFYVTANCDADDSSEVSGPFNFATLFEQAPPGDCEWTLEMLDSFGDGWNGALLNVFRNGQIVLEEVALDDDPNNDGSVGVLLFEVLPGDDITTQLVDGGAFSGEISYNILNADGVTLEGSGDADNDILPGTITGDCTLSVGDNTLEGFNFFPNPAENIVNINAQQAVQNITVFSLAGQKLMDQNIQAATATLDVSRLATGTYIMQVTSNEQIGTYKLIKK